MNERYRMIKSCQITKKNIVQDINTHNGKHSYLLVALSCSINTFEAATIARKVPKKKKKDGTCNCICCICNYDAKKESDAVLKRHD